MALSCDIVHRVVMVALHPCLLTGCSALTTLELIEDVPASVCFGAHAVHDYNIEWRNGFVLSSFNSHAMHFKALLLVALE